MRTARSRPFAAGHDDVGRFDVAVEHPLVVGHLQPGDDVDRHPQRRRHRQRPPAEPVGQRLAGDAGLDEVEPSVLVAAGQQRPERLGAEPFENVGLVLEPQPQRGRHPRRRHRLDDDRRAVGRRRPRRTFLPRCPPSAGARDRTEHRRGPPTRRPYAFPAPDTVGRHRGCTLVRPVGRGHGGGWDQHREPGPYAAYRVRYAPFARHRPEGGRADVLHGAPRRRPACDVVDFAAVGFAVAPRPDASPYKAPTVVGFDDVPFEVKADLFRQVKADMRFPDYLYGCYDCEKLRGCVPVGPLLRLQPPPYRPPPDRRTWNSSTSRCRRTSGSVPSASPVCWLSPEATTQAGSS